MEEGLKYTLLYKCKGCGSILDGSDVEDGEKALKSGEYNADTHEHLDDKTTWVCDLVGFKVNELVED